jgi:hypothetical protein
MPAKAGIQYAVTSVKTEIPAFTGSSASADDDIEWATRAMRSLALN